LLHIFIWRFQVSNATDFSVLASADIGPTAHQLMAKVGFLSNQETLNDRYKIMNWPEQAAI